MPDPVVTTDPETGNVTTTITGDGMTTHETITDANGDEKRDSVTTSNPDGTEHVTRTDPDGTSHDEPPLDVVNGVTQQPPDPGPEEPDPFEPDPFDPDPFNPEPIPEPIPDVSELEKKLATDE